MKQEWAWLIELNTSFGSTEMAVVRTGLRCRRVLQVQENASGKAWLCARVPLPKALQEAPDDR